MEPGSVSEGLGKLNGINIAAVYRPSLYNVWRTQYFSWLFLLWAEIEIVFIDLILFVWVDFLELLLYLFISSLIIPL